mgnify:CR=1 FL=1
MGARAIGAVILMIFGLILVVYSGGGALADEVGKGIVFGVGILFWLLGSVALFFVSGSRASRNGVGALFVFVAVLLFLFSTGEIQGFLRMGMLTLSVVTILTAFAFFVTAGMVPPSGESFPMGSPQNIPPKMPVLEKKEKE